MAMIVRSSFKALMLMILVVKMISNSDAISGRGEKTSTAGQLYDLLLGVVNSLKTVHKNLSPKVDVYLVSSVDPPLSKIEPLLTEIVAFMADVFRTLLEEVDKNANTLNNARGIVDGEPAVQKCPTSYTIYPNLGCVKKYITTVRTWPEARQRCQEEGGDLVTYNAGWETNNGPLADFLGSEIYRYWIGLSRVNSTSWNWIVNGLLPLTNEAPTWSSNSYPENENWNCVLFEKDDNKMFSAPCNTHAKLNYVCKILTP